MPAPLLIGTRGWEHPDWVPDFYPAELPDDWRLCFYSNRLRSVLVPADIWKTVDAVTVAGWRADSDPDFRFVLEPPAALYVPGADALSGFLTLIEPLSTQVAGFLLRPAQSLGIESLGVLLRALGARAPLSIDMPFPLPEVTERLLDEHGVGRLWDAERTDAPRAGGGLRVGVARRGDPRRLRALIEAMGAWRSEDATAALFFDNASEGARLAEQARTLAEFMGV